MFEEASSLGQGSFASMTITTVGYGDCYPISTGGKAVAGCIMLGGMLILALPITVIGSNFVKMVELYATDHRILRGTPWLVGGCMGRHSLQGVGRVQGWCLFSRPQGEVGWGVDGDPSG